MAIPYKVIERGEPGVQGGGTKKYYASAQTTGNLDIEELTEQIERISTVSGADIRAVLYGIVDVVPKLLSNGNIVQIGDLGSFRISISSEASEAAADVTAAKVKKAKILFRPGKKFSTMLKTLEYKRV